VIGPAASVALAETKHWNTILLRPLSPGGAHLRGPPPLLHFPAALLRQPSSNTVRTVLIGITPLNGGPCPNGCDTRWRIVQHRDGYSQATVKGPLPDRLFGKAKYSRRESRCLTRTDIQRLRVSREERRWRRVEARYPPSRDDPWPRKRLPVTFSEATAQNVVTVTDCSMLAVVQSGALRCAPPPTPHLSDSLARCAKLLARASSL
jgi:hypothetical protein